MEQLEKRNVNYHNFKEEVIEKRTFRKDMKKLVSFLMINMPFLSFLLTSFGLFYVFCDVVFETIYPMWYGYAAMVIGVITYPLTMMISDHWKKKEEEV